MKNKFLIILALIAFIFCENLSAQQTCVTNPGASWTVPAGVTTATVYCWGGGGGGGSGLNSGAAYGNGGGGGGGACAISVLTVVAGQVYTITQGAGGAGGAAGNNPGAAGGTTTFTGTGGTVSAAGGAGGTGSNAAGGAHAGGAGGSTGTGSTIYSGGSGSAGNDGTGVTGTGGGGAGSGGNGTTPASACGVTGTGGTGTYAGGNGGYNPKCSNTSSGIGVAGAAPGGGGSGGDTYLTNSAGGAGGAGQVVVCYCTSNCSGTPTAGTATTSVSSACGSASPALGLTGSTTGCGITYQWQSSPDNVTWSNIGGATSATYTPTITSTTYYRCVVTCTNGGASSNSSSVSVTVTGGNDACANATSLGNSSISIAGTNACANSALEGIDTYCQYAGGGLANNVWYTFTPTQPGLLSVVVAGGTIVSPITEVYTGSCGSLTMFSTCGSGTASTFTTTAPCLTAGTTYYIMVQYDTKVGNAGTFTLTATYTPLTNDLCANASPVGAFTTINNAAANTVTYSVSVIGNNSCAAADQTSPSCNTANQNIWYTFTAPVTGSYYVGVDAGSIKYPDVAVWSGSCGSLTLLGCAGVANTLGCTTGTANGTTQPNGFDSQTYAYAGACNLTAGQVVYVSVDNWCGWNPGTFTLSIVNLSNDEIAVAGIIAGCGTAFNSSTIGATNCNNCTGDGGHNNLDCNGASTASGNSSGADVYPGMSVENDSWYTFCTTTAQTYSVTFTPTTATCKGPGPAQLQMNLFTGTATNLTWINGSSTGTSLTYTVALAANGCAFIEVDGLSGENCDYAITLNASPGCPLSLALLSFKGDNIDNKNIKLTWELASESDVNYYEVERSANGIDYSHLAKVKSVGNSTVKGSYHAVDGKPLNGNNYYRLSSVDINGVQNIASQIVVTNKSHLSDFSVYPNPARDKINVSLVNFSSAVTIEIYDMYGKQVFSSVAIPENGNMLQEIDLSSFTKGVYFVKAFDGENIFKQSIIVNNDR